MIRCMGVITVLYCAYGLVFFVWELGGNGRRLGSPNSADWVIFALLSAVSVGVTIYLAYLGIRMSRSGTAAIGRLCFLFGAEIVYFMVTTIIFWNIAPPTNPDLTGGFFGIPAAPFVPQLFTGFPIICPLVCFFVQRKGSSERAVA